MLSDLKYLTSIDIFLDRSNSITFCTVHIFLGVREKEQQYSRTDLSVFSILSRE